MKTKSVSTSNATKQPAQDRNTLGRVWVGRKHITFRILGEPRATLSRKDSDRIKKLAAASGADDVGKFTADFMRKALLDLVNRAA